MKYGGNTFEKREKLIQVSLFSIVCTWYYCKKWTNAKKLHLEELCSTVHAVCECHALQQLHSLRRYLMLRMCKFHYRTMIGKHVMVTWYAVMAFRQLSTADQERAIAWLQDGAMQWNVAQRLNVSQSIIGRFWIRFLDMGNVNNQPRSGRPQSTTQREDQYITNWTFHQSRVTARQLHDHLRTTTGTLTLSQTTNFRLFQTERVCRRQFQIWWKWQKALEMGRKHCGKKEKLLIWAISPFPTVFSKDLYCRHVKTRACLGKG